MQVTYSLAYLSYHMLYHQGNLSWNKIKLTPSFTTFHHNITPCGMKHSDYSTLNWIIYIQSTHKFVEYFHIKSVISQVFIWCNHTCIISLRIFFDENLFLHYIIINKWNILVQKWSNKILQINVYLFYSPYTTCFLFFKIFCL